MKKLLSIVLAVVMVLGVTASAMAFNWAKPATTDTTKFGFEIDVIKFTRSTAALGSSQFNKDDNATAVNGADVYYAIKLVVDDPDADVDAVVESEVSFTAVGPGGTIKIANADLRGIPDGIYYLDVNAAIVTPNPLYLPIEAFIANQTHNMVAETPVIAAVCADTDTAKVTAKVTAKTPIPTTTDLKCGDYEIQITETQANSGDVIFKKGGKTVATFKRNTKGLVTEVQYVAGKEQDVLELYKWLNDGSADAIYNAIKNKELYMTDDNLRAAFGFNFSTSDSVTWKASPNPIIVGPAADPIGIPKTGDASSVVGFAMIMVAIVAAAVAVKKVKA